MFSFYDTLFRISGILWNGQYVLSFNNLCYSSDQLSLRKSTHFLLRKRYIRPTKKGKTYLRFFYHFYLKIFLIWGSVNFISLNFSIPFYSYWGLIIFTVPFIFKNIWLQGKYFIEACLFLLIAFYSPPLALLACQTNILYVF